MKKSLILIGGGGHCKSCIDVIEAEGSYVIEGILDTADKVGTSVLQYPIVGDDSSIGLYVQKGCSCLVTVGQVKSAALRKKLFHILVEQNAVIATIISPLAMVSRHAQIGRGTIVMHGAQVNAGARVGNNSILNSGCLVEHDAVVGDHVHISTHAVLNGDVVVENDCFIGSNSVINHGMQVKAGSILGSGSVIIHDLRESAVYAGNPAKRISK